MESIQGIMIRTEILRNRLPSNSSIEHATQCPAIDHTGVNAESDDAPRVLVHNDEYPVRPQSHRLTSEQINAVKTIYRVTNESERGRSAAIGRRMVMGGQNPPDDILINRIWPPHRVRRHEQQEPAAGWIDRRPLDAFLDVAPPVTAG